MLQQSFTAAPKKHGGKPLTFEETFRSPFERDTVESALAVLESIRDVHDAAHGWLELDANIEKLPNDKYRAVRHHAQYKFN